MNWYKRSQQMYPAYIPDNREFESLTGKSPNESGSKPGATYQPGESYQGGERRLPFNVPGEVDPYAVFMMDLKTEIASVEENIESYKEELKNPNLSTRSRKLPVDISRERRRIKGILQGEIKRLRGLRARLLRETRKKTMYPRDIEFLNETSTFRNPR